MYYPPAHPHAHPHARTLVQHHPSPPFSPTTANPLSNAAPSVMRLYLRNLFAHILCNHCAPTRMLLLGYTCATRACAFGHCLNPLTPFGLFLGVRLDVRGRLLQAGLPATQYHTRVSAIWQDQVGWMNFAGTLITLGGGDRRCFSATQMASVSMRNSMSSSHPSSYM